MHKLRLFAPLRFSLSFALTLSLLSLTACGGGGDGGGASRDSTAGATLDQRDETTQVKVKGGASETNPSNQAAPTAKPGPLSPNIEGTPQSPTSVWGTSARPFRADSPWNSRPIAPRLSGIGVPPASFVPSVEEGAFGSAVFVAKPSDAAMEVLGPSDGKGIWDPDAQREVPSVVIPRWPEDTAPSTSSDGHCEIVDPATGIVHSFWKLVKDGGVWRATQYAWTRIDGRGWAEPAHSYQGARAAGVSTLGGLIRKHEVNDGDSSYRHALALSLSYNGLAATPAYLFPAVATDNDAATTNSGQIPMGALLMLPQDFDTSTIASQQLRKIAETFKRYGGYVVDRNTGTPFVVYAEIGANVNLHGGGWNNAVANDLQRIRAALRMVESTAGWLDGNGNPTSLQEDWNLLSMRGPWRLVSGTSLGVYNTWEQRLEFDFRTTATVQENANSNGFSRISWAMPTAGKRYRLTARTTGGARLGLRLVSHIPTESVNTGWLENGQSVEFRWPSSMSFTLVRAMSGINQASTVAGDLVEIR